MVCLLGFSRNSRYPTAELRLLATRFWPKPQNGLPVGGNRYRSNYGDATGSGRRSSASQTDWQIVREFFIAHQDRFKASYHVRSSNPEVKDRIACVNKRLKTQAGEYF